MWFIISLSIEVISKSHRTQFVGRISSICARVHINNLVCSTVLSILNTRNEVIDSFLILQTHQQMYSFIESNALNISTELNSPLLLVCFPSPFKHNNICLIRNNQHIEIKRR